MTHTQERVTTAVRMLMGAQRLKQADLARALGISQPSVSAKMHGRSRWSVDDLDKLAERFAVPLPDLLNPPMAFAGAGSRMESVTQGARPTRLRPAGGSVLTLPLRRTAFQQVAA